MEQHKSSISEFLTQVFVIFSISVLFLLFVGSIVGDETKPFSTMFSLGSQGLATSTMLQFLLSSFLVVLIRYFFNSRRIFKNMTTLTRTVLMICCIFFMVIFFISVFHWFSFSNLYAWFSFIITFTLFVSGSMIFFLIKARLKSKEYEKLLMIYKQNHKGDDKNE